MNNNTVLSIAGSDSGGGAGIQADIKTISANACYASTVITAITAQNTCGVTDIHPIPVSSVKAQLEAVLSDIGADAVKIGMLHNADTIKAVYDSLQKYHIKNSVLDPVMLSTSGKVLLQTDAIATLSTGLIPNVRVMTPNIPEAEWFLGQKLKTVSDLTTAAKALSEKYGNISILLKAGHFDGKTLTDVFYNAETNELITLISQRIPSKNTHGTGCTLSSALAAHLAKGYKLNDAVKAAKDYTNKAIEAGKDDKIGKGHGPVKHFYKYWEQD